LKELKILDKYSIGLEMAEHIIKKCLNRVERKEKIDLVAEEARYTYPLFAPFNIASNILSCGNYVPDPGEKTIRQQFKRKTRAPTTDNLDPNVIEEDFMEMTNSSDDE
jgi:hypothetical protein